MRTFDHAALEEKWRTRWDESGLYRVEDVVPGKENKYVLVEFPYPSGNLHIGHWYAFAVPDIYARYLRMRGYNVLFPIGFDAFGLPAENAAIKHKLDPRTWTEGNIAYMTEQLKSMGNCFDWSRQVAACDPDYYRWTQWLFLKLYEKGLAYRKQSTVPWCDSCKTVLANEQIFSGACERCGTEVVQKDLEQWFFRITDYADRLLADLDELPWPEEIKRAQREWIGRSEGARISFNVQVKSETEANTNANRAFNAIDVFTTRADTLFGVTYVVLAPEHALVQELRDSIENWGEVSAYVERTKKKKELERKEGKDKTGVVLKGVYAVNPANGEEVPVWIADYVLASYGTGAVMAVPAHDERDYAFAKVHHLPVREVVGGGDVRTAAYTGSGVLLESGRFTGVDSVKAIPDIVAHVHGTMTTQYRLRDWLLSRQRYWGAPIPIVYDPEGKPHPVPEEHLPWLLPTDVDFTPTGEAPLARSKELRERTERLFGKGWTPEVDTMDTFVDSSWYFLRYLDPHNDTEFCAREKQERWMPVAHYSGGAEHVTMHLLYSRFFYKVLFDLGLVTQKEPYARRLNRGLILGPDGQKMSKSKGNVVDPGEHVARVGADTVKMYLAFVGPYAEVGQYPWDLGGIAGVRRFLERVWGLGERVGGRDNRQWTTDETRRDNGQRTMDNREDETGGGGDDATMLVIAQTIKKIGEDIEAFKFNTAISQLMVLVNALEKLPAIPAYAYETLIRMIAPFAPFLAEELWERLGHTTSVHHEPWPTYDVEILARAEVTVTVQVNGKMRATMRVTRGLGASELAARARALEPVAVRLLSGTVTREVVVPDRLVNFVVS